MITNEYKEFLKFLKEKKKGDILPLTKTQHNFVEWLLEENQGKMLMQIGDLNNLFIYVRQYLKETGNVKKTNLEKN